MQKKIRNSFIILFSALIAVLLFACVLLFTPKTAAHADDNLQEGEQSTDLYWGFNSDTGALTLSQGETAAADNEYSRVYIFGKTYPEWHNYRNDITSVTVVGTPTAPQDLVSWFYQCENLTSVDLTGLDTSNVTDMSEMFYYCVKMETLKIPNFNTAKVENMRVMFGGCKALTTLDLSKFITEKVESMDGMFTDCNALETLDLSNFDTENVTDMRSMFASCKALKTLNLSNFKTGKVYSMIYMFQCCESLTSLDLSNFNTENVTDMACMFADCKVLETLNLSDFNTEKVKNMSMMFSGCNALETLDLSSFNTENTTETNRMFKNCDNLNEIKTPAKIGTKPLPLPCRFVYENDEGKFVGIEEVASENANKTIYRHAECTPADQPETENVVAATCMLAGSYDQVIYCTSQFHEEMSRTTVPTGFAYDNHSWNTEAWSFNESGHWHACSNGCGNKQDEESHAEETVAAVLPTCTESGLTAGKRCSECETVLEEQTTVAALGHTLTHHEATAATVEKEGNIEYWSCSECENYFEDGNGETVIEDKSSVILPKLTPPTTEDPPEEDPPAEPTACAECQKKSYVWICWLLIPLALAVGGVALGVWLYKKNKED